MSKHVMLKMVMGRYTPGHPGAKPGPVRDGRMIHYRVTDVPDDIQIADVIMQMDRCTVISAQYPSGYGLWEISWSAIAMRPAGTIVRLP